MLAGRKQTAIVFFLDETFEELEFDATSTVLEAVEYLAGVIKLQSYQTFTLYECRKVRGTLPADGSSCLYHLLQLCISFLKGAG